MENIAFDSHKRYTLCSVEDEKGSIVSEDWIRHERGAIREYLERFTPGSSVAVETIGNWYRHVSRLYERIRSKKGHPQAIGAVARHLAEAVSWVLKNREGYQEPKPKRFLPKEA